VFCKDAGDIVMMMMMVVVVMVLIKIIIVIVMNTESDGVIALEVNVSS